MEKRTTTSTRNVSQETEIVNAVKVLSKELKKIKAVRTNDTTQLSSVARKELSDIVRHVDRAVKDSPLSWIPAKEKFFTTIGIEYTFLKRKNVKTSEDELVKRIIKLSDKRQKWNKKVHQDGPKVIEFASPAHSNWPEMLKTFRTTVKTAKKVGLVFKRHDEGSGGGHIHMGIPKHWQTHFRLKFLKILYLDIASRPYINWIFNEPIDDRNASSMLTTRDGIRFLKRLHQQSYMNINNIDGLSGKSFAARYDNEYDTVEFRCFDMPENEQMLEEYVEFINAYFRYIYNIAKNHYYSTEYSVSYYSITNTSLDKFRDKKYVVSEFNKLLKEIGLNPVKYKKYISKNYDVRVYIAKRGDVKMDYDCLAAIDVAGIGKITDDDEISNRYEIDECDYDSRVISQNQSNQLLHAVLDASGNLSFVKVEKNKAKYDANGNIIIDSNSNDEPSKAIDQTLFESNNIDLGHSWSSSGTVERETIDVPAEDFEIIETEQRAVQPAFIAEETMEGVCKYILGPGNSKTILGIPISNSSPDRFLIVTKNADDSLTFKYFNNLSELSTPVETLQDNEALRNTEPFTENDSLVGTDNVPENIPVEAGGTATNNVTGNSASLEEVVQNINTTLTEFRNNGDVTAARNSLNLLLHRINGGDSYF